MLHPELLCVEYGINCSARRNAKQNKQQTDLEVTQYRGPHASQPQRYQCLKEQGPEPSQPAREPPQPHISPPRPRAPAALHPAHAPLRARGRGRGLAAILPRAPLKSGGREPSVSCSARLPLAFPVLPESSAVATRPGARPLKWRVPRGPTLRSTSSRCPPGLAAGRYAERAAAAQGEQPLQTHPGEWRRPGLGLRALFIPGPGFPAAPCASPCRSRALRRRFPPPCPGPSGAAGAGLFLSPVAFRRGPSLLCTL